MPICRCKDNIFVTHNTINADNQLFANVCDGFYQQKIIFFSKCRQRKVCYHNYLDEKVFKNAAFFFECICRKVECFLFLYGSIGVVNS